MNSSNPNPLIIVVDDNKDWVQSCKLLFETSHTCEVRMAWSEWTAIERVRDLERPATILIDVHLGARFEGPKILKMMRKHQRHTTIAIYTSGDTESEIETIRMGGAIKYLVKPRTQNEVPFYTDIVMAYAETVLPEEVAKIRLARRDPLTGLYNRAEFFEIATLELDFAARNNTPTSAIFVDSDNFKSVNDAYGHGTGDEVLQEIARCIVAHKQMRSTDRAVRWGGDEFVALLPATTYDQALTVARRLKQDIAQTQIQVEGGGTISTSVSIGIATVDPADINRDNLAGTLEKLIAECDTKLYEEKQRKGAGR